MLFQKSDSTVLRAEVKLKCESCTKKIKTAEFLKVELTHWGVKRHCDVRSWITAWITTAQCESYWGPLAFVQGLQRKPPQSKPEPVRWNLQREDLFPSLYCTLFNFLFSPSSCRFKVLEQKKSVQWKCYRQCFHQTARVFAVFSQTFDFISCFLTLAAVRKCCTLAVRAGKPGKPGLKTRFSSLLNLFFCFCFRRSAQIRTRMLASATASQEPERISPRVASTT